MCVWIEQFVSWLHSWNRYNVQHDSGFLSKEAYISLTHTVGTLLLSTDSHDPCEWGGGVLLQYLSNY